MKEYTKFIILVLFFGVIFILPVESPVLLDTIRAGLLLLQEYVRYHTLTCLVPAFFIAGGITVFLRKESIYKLLGHSAKKYISYSIASTSGAILTACSCTILPLFAGIYQSGAGLGPAVAFLFTGPAINVTAIFLTAKILGWEISIIRIIASFVIAIIIGYIMTSIFRKEEIKRSESIWDIDRGEGYKAIVVFSFFISLILILIVYSLKIPMYVKYIITGISLIVLVYIIFFRFDREDNENWIMQTWDFTKKILPLLFIGVFIAGILSVVVPENIVTKLVGGNTVYGNLIASVFGAFMYFATLTEIPIIQKLMGLGMGKGPALALFLAGYTLSFPNMIALIKIMGKNKAFTYFILVVLFSTTAGFVYGNFF
ncbi:permease [candidate division KSB1 bacterium]|nr:MAG: permease [candidate division KSB1 bacterium]